ncbi:MAG TPA: hypothetical protein DCL49_14575 [Candidatus Omnitrophica bacterium]|nr:hypothetical protein [Candidatus Omnitrophota bacterium]
MSAQAKHGIVLMIMGVVLFFACTCAFFRWKIVAQVIACVTMLALTSVMVWAGWILFSVKVKKDA